MKRVLWPNAEINDEGGRQFRIFATDRGVCKGPTPWRPTMGEKLVLTATGNGRDGWGVSKYNGEPEFNFAYAEHDEPIDERAKLEYACQLTKGMGGAMANAIWEARHEGWRGVQPGEVRGYTATIHEAFTATLASLDSRRDRADAISWLLSIGASMRLAEAAYDKWQGQTIPTVKADCYRLASLPHFAFADVDRIVAPRFGIRGVDPRRLNAALLYFAAQLSENSTLVAWTDLRNAVVSATGADANAIATCAKALFGANRLAPFPKASPPSLAIPRLAEAEREIAAFARRAS